MQYQGCPLDGAGRGSAPRESREDADAADDDAASTSKKQNKPPLHGSKPSGAAAFLVGSLHGSVQVQKKGWEENNKRMPGCFSGNLKIDLP